MVEIPAKSVGLGGDGDEIAAIEEVERAFGVKLDYADASGWVTAGDVFASLQGSLPADERGRPDQWQRFAAALAGPTGVNPDEIEPSSPLLSDSRFWARLANMSALIWVITIAGFLVLFAAAAL